MTNSCIVVAQCTGVDQHGPLSANFVLGSNSEVESHSRRDANPGRLAKRSHCFVATSNDKKR
jgi:hypothetical protein